MQIPPIRDAKSFINGVIPLFMQLSQFANGMIFHRNFLIPWHQFITFDGNPGKRGRSSAGIPAIKATGVKGERIY